MFVLLESGDEFLDVVEDSFLVIGEFGEGGAVGGEFLFEGGDAGGKF